MELIIENLSKKYSDKMALRDFSCVFPEGVTLILGPNGAGKSTLMNLITDNVRRDSGKILFNESDVLDLARKFRKVLSYMPQEQGLYSDFSAKAFLHYIAELKGMDRKETKREISLLLELVELSHVAHRKLSTYSGGMRQRILLCQALLGDPKVVLLDEPTAGLDVEERIRITGYIDGFAKGRIILWSTHIVTDIRDDDTRILIIGDGKTLALGSLKELKERTGLSDPEDIYMYYMDGERANTDV